MADGAVSQFTQSHSFVSGLILAVVGGVGVYGAISGNLASMIAALVDPTDLYVANTSGGGLIGIPVIGDGENTEGGSGEGGSGDSSGGEGSGGSGGGTGDVEGGAGAIEIGTNTNATSGGSNAAPTVPVTLV